MHIDIESDEVDLLIVGLYRLRPELSAEMYERARLLAERLVVLDLVSDRHLGLVSDPDASG